MRKLKYLLLVIGIVFTLPSRGQTFYRLYGNTGVNEGGLSIISSPDGNILTAGYKNDSALVMKTDPFGNLIWIRTFKPVSGGNNIVHQITVTPDGYIAGIGNAIISGLYGDMFHFKLDVTGNLIWLNRVMDTRRIFAESIVAKSASEYVVIADLYDLSSPSSADVIAYRIDASTGAVIANTPRLDYISSNSHIDDPYSATLNSAGNRIYTTGRIYVNGAPADGMRPYLTKLDLNGNHLSTAYLGWTAAQSARIYGTDLVYNNDSVAICYFGDVTGASSNYTIGLIRTDTSGNIAWSKNYNITSTGSEIASKVIATPTGYYIVGYTIGGTNDFFIISTSLNGTLLWAKSYGGATTAESFFVTTSPVAGVINNQIYFTGQSLTGTNKNLVIAAADMSGNISCITVNSLVITTTNNPTNRTIITPASVPALMNFSSGGILTAQPIPDACSVTHLNLGNDTSTCSNYTLNATLPSAISYLWNDGSTSPTLTTSSSGTYWVTVTANCCIYNDTIVITNGQPPLAGFTSSVTGCSSTTNFTNVSAGATSYYWDFGDSSTDTTISPTHTYSSTGSYTVSLVVTNSCGTDTATQVLVIQTIPTSTISGVDTICQGESVTLVANGGNQVQWSGGSSATTFTINVTPQTTTLYVATMSNGNCVGTPDSHTVVVIPAPVVTISGPSTICAMQNITLTANGVGNYQWSGGSSATSSSISVNPATTTTYYVTSSDNICTSLADTFVVTVLPAQTVTIVGPTTICYGQTVTLVANGASSYQWSGGSSDTTSAIQVNPTSTTTYFASPGSSTCPGIPDTFIVNVVPTPIVNISGNPTICQGQSTTLTATGGTAYQWSGGSTDTTASIVVSPIATTTYFVTASNGTCFSPFDTITVTVIPPPTVSIVGGGPICPGNSISLTAVGNATTYIWSGGVTATGQTISDNPATATTYYVVGYNQQGCSDSDMVTVLIYDTPTYAIIGDDSICAGESTTLSCPGSGTFSWSPSTALNSTSLASVVSTPTSNITYMLQVVDVNGCTGTDSITIVVSSCVGIEEQTSNGELNVSPNPSNTTFNLNISSNNTLNIQVYDVLGNVVLSDVAVFDGQNNFALDMSEFASGTYFLVAYAENFFATEKLILTN